MLVISDIWDVISYLRYVRCNRQIPGSPHTTRVICMYTCAHTYMQICTGTHIMHTWCTCAHPVSHTHSQHSYTFTHTHTSLHPSTHTDTDIHTQIHIHTHTHIMTIITIITIICTSHHLHSEGVFGLCGAHLPAQKNENFLNNLVF